VRKEERDGFATWRRGRSRGKDERKRGCLTERVGCSMTMRVMVFIFMSLFFFFFWRGEWFSFFYGGSRLGKWWEMELSLVGDYG
jgi:hypothetical protein